MNRIAFIYPGQGAQKAGMGRDFYEKGTHAKTVFDQAQEVLDFDIRSVCFEENELLNQTSYTQPALVTTCLAITEEILNMDIWPSAAAGLSLGEYAAISVCGGMSVQDAIRTVRARGIFMNEAAGNGQGSMAAVLGMTDVQVAQVIDQVEGAYIANYNCPGQIVITGQTEAVKKAGQLLLEAGARRVLPLNVSGPFHSPFLKEAGIRLGEVLKGVHLKNLRLPYVTNVTGDYVCDIEETPDLLERQVASSVLWEQSMRRLINDGVEVFVEIGPGKTLAGFMKKIDRSVKVINVSEYADLEKLAAYVGV